MARLNEVHLYGIVSHRPRIIKTDDGRLVRGMMHVTTIRSERYKGETFGATELFDYPLVITTQEEQIRAMEKLGENDIVEVKGIFVTRKVKKEYQCKNCGATNKVDGNLTYVSPIFMRKRNTKKSPYTENMAKAELLDNRAVSNSILITGNLCHDPSYYKSANGKYTIETAVYQIATDRRYFLIDDPVTVRTDYPVVRTYGKQAAQDSLCCHTGTLVLIDGFLHTREFDRVTECSACKKAFPWKDNTTEIIPFAEDYLANYTDPDEAIRQKKEKLAAEGNRLATSVFKS